MSVSLRLLLLSAVALVSFVDAFAQSVSDKPIAVLVAPLKSTPERSSVAVVALMPAVLPAALLNCLEYASPEKVSDCILTNAEVAAGAFLLYRTADSLVDRYVLERLPYSRWFSAGNAKLRKNPASILFIDGTKEHDPISAVVARTMNSMYRGKNLVGVRANSLDDLMRKLKAYKQENPATTFDRIEILGHGNPGQISLGGVHTFDFVDFRRIRKAFAELDLVQADAEVRVTSCSLGYSYTGDGMLGEMGKTFLPRGGKIIGATRNIMYTNADRAKEFFTAAGVAGAPIKMHYMNDYDSPTDWAKLLKTAKEGAIKTVLVSPEGETTAIRSRTSQCLRTLTQTLDRTLLRNLPRYK